MKLVVSFCLYGHSSKYCLGAIENVELIQKNYPEWQIYMYYNNIPNGIYEKLKELGCKMFPYDSKESKSIGMFYRFLPFHDKSIDYWISRDCDSRITDREMSFVNEWIKSNKMFHIIRDNKFHLIEILGGTFGVNNKLFHAEHNINVYDYIEKYYENTLDVDRGPDQLFLVQQVWGLIKDNHVAHISMQGLRYHENDILVEPVFDHVGRITAASDETIIKYGKLLSSNNLD